MVATPIGYEAFQGKRRKSVALLCFMLSSAIIASTMVFVDSHSMTVWSANNDVGPVAMVALGSGIDSKIQDFRAIEGIDSAAAIRGSITYLTSLSLGLRWQANSFGMAYNEEFMEAFPTIFMLVDGRFPENASEMALSVLFADILHVELGDQVNYSYLHRDPTNPSYLPTLLTGTFEHGESNNTNPYYYSRAHVILHSSISPTMQFSFIYADVDRNKVVPHDPKGALDYLNQIDEQIRMLDPYYTREGRAEYAVVNFLSDGIEDYLSYLSDLRLSQVLRSGGVILLELAVIYLAINHIWSERDYEVSILAARGASRFRVGLSENLEIITMAVISILPGFAAGVVVSRFAIASDGFFMINFQSVFTEPLLISFDS
ncbi:MAG: hypothetical protein ACXAC0_10600, partial [Candidatus Thorarchaeota archaeon]